MQKNIFCCFLAAWVFCAHFSANAQTYQQQIDSALSPLITNYITTGILYDRVYPLANLNACQGTDFSDTTCSDHFQQAYYELYQSAYSRTNYTPPVTVNQNVKTNYSALHHPIGILYYDYNSIDTLAENNAGPFQYFLESSHNMVILK